MNLLQILKGIYKEGDKEAALKNQKESPSKNQDDLLQKYSHAIMEEGTIGEIVRLTIFIESSLHTDAEMQFHMSNVVIEKIQDNNSILIGHTLEFPLYEQLLLEYLKKIDDEINERKGLRLIGIGLKN